MGRQILAANAFMDTPPLLPPPHPRPIQVLPKIPTSDHPSNPPPSPLTHSFIHSFHPLKPFLHRQRNRKNIFQPFTLQIPLRCPSLRASGFIPHIDQGILPRLFVRVVAVIVDAVEGFMVVGFEVDEGADFVFVLDLF